MDHEHLRDEYPAIITMEQLYRICRVSKRHARWLLEQGVIPCQDSGKQTRRFQIRLDDVIIYLQRREAGVLPEAHEGVFSSAKPQSRRRKYLDSDGLAAHILTAWSTAPDALTAAQAVALCGYCATTVNNWLQKGAVQGICYYGKNLLTKDSLAQHLASPAGQCIQHKSPQHQGLLDGYRQGMEQGRAEMEHEENSDMDFGSMSL